MGQNQVKRDAESPESISLLNPGRGGGKESQDPNTNFNFPLHLAACRGDLAKVELLHCSSESNSSSGSDTLTRGLDENERTPLHCATHPASSRNSAVIRLLLQHDKEDNPSSDGKPLLANLQDSSQKTALHYAVASQASEVVVSLLLEFGADPNLKDAQGSSPLHILAQSNSDSALACAKLILDSGSLDASAGSATDTDRENNTPVHIAAKNKAPKLLSLFVERGFDYACPGGLCESRTPLMDACTLLSDSDSGDNLECVRILLNAYSREQVNARDEDGKTALSMAVSVKILELLVSSPKTDLFTRDFENFTVFHHMIDCNRLASVKFLCECEQMRSKDRFVDIIFNSHKPKKEGDLSHSPIGIALHCRYTEIVEYLLAEHPNQDEWMSDEVLMSLIYSKHPTVLMTRLDEGLKHFAYGGQDSVAANFSIITGGKDPVKQMAQETKHLYRIKDAPKDDQKLILLHPLVQIFLERKWGRMRRLTWTHIIVQLSWIFCYTLVVYEMYAPNCHNTRPNQTETEEYGSGEDERGRRGYVRILTSLAFLQSEEDCRFNQTTVRRTAVVLYLLSTLILLRECFQMIVKSCSYFRDFINWVQLGLLLVAVVNSAPAWHLSNTASDQAPWQTSLAAIGMFVSWVMLLSELDNIPKCAVYFEIVKTVLWNCLKTMLFYCPLLIGCAMCLRLLIPGKGQYKYLLFSLVKVVVMMTGELEFEDAFYGKVPDPSTAYNYNDILGQIMFLLLVFVTTIVLLNLLTGLAVRDVGRLLEEADVHRLSLQLERMYLLEGLILWTRSRINCFGSWKNLLYYWNVTGSRVRSGMRTKSKSLFASWGPNIKYGYYKVARLPIKDYPAELQARIREVMGRRGMVER